MASSSSPQRAPSRRAIASAHGRSEANAATSEGFGEDGGPPAPLVSCRVRSRRSSGAKVKGEHAVVMDSAEDAALAMDEAARLLREFGFEARVSP